MDDDNDHPSDVAYRAGRAYARALRRRGFKSMDEAERFAKGLAKAYEDAEAYMDGFWDQLHSGMVS